MDDAPRATICAMGFRPNAYIIAAAPDLLSAVKAWVDYVDDPDEMGSFPFEGEVMDRMRAAIAKAEGLPAPDCDGGDRPCDNATGKHTWREPFDERAPVHCISCNAERVS